MRTGSITKEDISPPIVCTAHWRLTKVKPLEDYKLEVEFVDGTHGIVDLVQRVMNPQAGVFASLKDTNLFNQVYLEYGVVTWPNEVDLAPDAMYDAIKSLGIWILR